MTGNLISTAVTAGIALHVLDKTLDLGIGGKKKRKEYNGKKKDFRKL